MSKGPIQSTPDFEHTARMLLFGMISNPKIVSTRSQLRDVSLKPLVNAAFRAAALMEERLEQERAKNDAKPE